MSTLRSQSGPLVSGPDIYGVPYRFVALGLVCLSVLLVMTDVTATTIALPTLAETFDRDENTILWAVLLNPMIVVTASMALGRFGDLYGRKRFFAMGFVLYSVGSIFVASSGSFAELMVARFVQSTGTTLVMANIAAIVAASFSPTSRALPFGIMSAMIGLGWASGPLYGGLMIEVLDWRAIYWARIPLGVAGALMVWRWMRDTPHDQRPSGVDIPGAMTMSGSLFAFVLGVNRGGAWGWDNPAIVGLFVASAVLAFVFVQIERRAASPVVALDLFRRPSYSGGALAAVLLYYGVTGALVLVPFYLVEAKGLSTLEAGAVLAALPFMMAITAPFAGWLSDKVAPRHLIVLGMVSGALGMGLVATMTVETGIAGIVIRLAIAGVGRGLFDSPNMAVLIGSVSPDRFGTASATANTSRAIGTSIGIAASGALFAAQSGAFARARSPLGLDDVAVRPEALLSGLELAMVVGAGLAAVGAIVAWFLMKRKTAPGDVSGGRGRVGATPSTDEA